MNKIKYCFLACLIWSITFNCIAQEKKFYFSLGYHLPAMSQEMSAHNETFQTTNKINSSYGQGFNMLVGLENPISKNFSWQLELRYLFGSTHTNRFPSSPNFRVGGKDPNETYANVLSISPLLVFHLSDKLYIKAGPLLGLSKVHYTVYYSDDEIHSESKTPLTPLIGLQGGFGFIFYQSSKISLFSELNLIGMSSKPKKLIVDETTSFGSFEVSYEDNLSRRVLNDEGFRYTRQPSIELPFGSVGVQLGISFQL